MQKALFLISAFIVNNIIVTKAQQTINVPSDIPVFVKKYMPVNATSVQDPLLISEAGKAYAYLLFYSNDDTTGYAIGDDANFGFSKPIIGLYIPSNNSSPITIDTFKNNKDQYIAIRSVFLCNADADPRKEIAVITSTYSEAGYWHGEVYKTFFYKYGNASAVPTLTKLKLTINGGCYCVGANGKMEHPAISDAMSIKKALIKRGCKQ